jgi:hypothetical protein
VKGSVTCSLVSLDRRGNQIIIVEGDNERKPNSLHV